MSEKIIEVLSLRKHYLCAAVLYAGLGLMTLGLMPDLPKAFACPACADGFVPVQVGESCDCQCPQ
ncbi:hypothetical protein FACS189454_03770 [Planctomycetales bacterium]|nr:hypothetical protein FACS189454_03770 [Planctomycetales bacterium]